MSSCDGYAWRIPLPPRICASRGSLTRVNRPVGHSEHSNPENFSPSHLNLPCSGRHRRNEAVWSLCSKPSPDKAASFPCLSLYNTTHRSWTGSAISVNLQQRSWTDPGNYSSVHQIMPASTEWFVLIPIKNGQTAKRYKPPGLISLSRAFVCRSFE